MSIKTTAVILAASLAAIWTVISALADVFAPIIKALGGAA